MKKLIAMLIIAAVLTSTIEIKANEAAIENEGVDMMLIIDKSLSMSWYDPDIETLEATNHLLNLSLETSNRVGFVVCAQPFEIIIQAQMVKIPAGITMPWGILGIGVSIVALLTGLGLLLSNFLKKRQVKISYPILNGTLECYFMKIPTGIKDIPLQSWSATFLATRNKISLAKLLKRVSLRSKMPEAEKIFVSITEDNTISIINKADIVCYKSGQEMTEKQITLRHGEGLYMVFQENTIEIELRMRKKGSN